MFRIILKCVIGFSTEDDVCEDYIRSLQSAYCFDDLDKVMQLCLHVNMERIIFWMKY